MKTSRFAIAVVRGSVDDSSDQACGLVSKIIVNREGGSAVVISVSNHKSHGHGHGYSIWMSHTAVCALLATGGVDGVHRDAIKYRYRSMGCLFLAT